MANDSLERSKTADLAALVSVSGLLFTLIRARIWSAENDPAKALDALKDIMAWSDAAHNLATFGRRIERIETGVEDHPDLLERDASGLVRALEKASARVSPGWPQVAQALREAVTLVTRLAEPVAPDQPDLYDEGPVVDA
jgi:hypothetical protein